MAAETQGVCRVCLKQFARYTCPRCNLRYCSLPCYQKHGPRCTEGFYREHVESELQDASTPAAERQRMLDILQRVQQQDAQSGSSEDEAGVGGEDEPCELSEATLAKLLLRAEAGGGELEVAPGDLTAAERSAFERAVAAGALRAMVPPWQPWWLAADAGSLALRADGTALVRKAGGEPGAAPPSEPGGWEGAAGAPPPPPREQLPQLRALARAPSPLLRWQLPQLLFAYCGVLRLFNGDYRGDPLEATAAALLSAPALEGAAATSDRSAAGGPPAAPPESIAEALLPCVEAAAGPALFGAGGRGAAVALLADVAALLALGRGAAVRALEDLRRLLQLALDATLPPGPAALRAGPPSAAAPAPRGAKSDPASGATAELHSPGGGAGSSGSAEGAPREAASSPRALSASAGPCEHSAAGPPGEAAAAAPGSRVAAVGRPPGTGARSAASRAAPNPRPGARGRRRLQAAERKLRFFLSWANEAPGAMYRALAEDVRGELARHSEGLTPGAGSAPGGAGRGAGAAGLAGEARGTGPVPGRGAGARRRMLVQEL